MMIKTISCILIGLLLNLSFLQTTALAESREHKSAKIKAGVVKLGVGKESKVQVKLFDKTKVKGYISEIREDSFTVFNEQTNVGTEIPYPKVRQVKGNNLSTGVTVAVVIGVIFVLAAIVALTSDEF